MKVILTEKVSTLGNIGEVVNVSAGYARNCLLPQRKAVVADEGNTAQMNHYNKMLGNKVAAEKAEAEATKSKLEGITLEFIKKVGTGGKLFGTVTNNDISQELERKGFTVERRIITVENPIKAVGTFGVKAKLFTGVEASFNVKVDVDPKQVEEMKKKAEALAAKKAKQAEAAALAKENGESEEGEEPTEKKELTDDEKLSAEADALLRS
tara:strand:- start:27122 stop:27751 length:630 start_codon:yes stop_codon:yes gene_type:complete